MVQAHVSSSSSQAPATEQDTSSTPTSAQAGPSNAVLQELISLLETTGPGHEAQSADAVDALLDAFGEAVLPEQVADLLDDPDPLASLEELLGLDPTCAVTEDGTSDPARADPQAESDPYLNQLDNPQAGSKSARTQCSPTSLTMSLLAIYDNDAARFFDAITPLLDEVGQQTDRDGQPEAALIGLMLATDWDAAFSRSPQHFESDPQWRASHAGDEVIQNPCAQAYIASCFEGVQGDGVTIASTQTTVEDGAAREPQAFDERWAWTQDAHNNGGEVSFQGSFTGAGHVVKLVEMDDKQMVVHDPFGMHLGRYLENGQAPTAAPTGAEAEALARRTAENSALSTQFEQSLETGETFDRWGERNTFSRSELEALDALQWVLVIEPESASGPECSSAGG